MSRTWTKGQIMIYKTLFRKLKIEKHEPHTIIMMFWMGKQFLLC